MALYPSDDFPRLVPGSVVFGRYKIIRILGLGATSVVYACARMPDNEPLLALKILSRRAAKDNNLRERFKHEIHMSYRVSHPNVVRGIEYLTFDSWHAYTMECVDSGNLGTLMEYERCFEIAECIRFISQLCSGLQAIHDAGITHRDIKPRNILMTNRFDLKITDFGTAVCPAEKSLPFDIGAVGTLDYMSPEVISEGRAIPASDIFGLGVVAYRLVTGELPFQGTTNEQQLREKLRGKFKIPKKLRGNCPTALSELIAKALHPEPGKRFRSAKEMLDEIYAPSAKSAKKSTKSLIRRLFSRPEKDSFNTDW